MAYTREIYTVDKNGKRGVQAGYARFDRNGNYLGSYGGRTKTGRTLGRNESQLRNTINTAGARGRSRNPMLY